MTCLLGSTGPPHTQTLGTGALTLLHRVPKGLVLKGFASLPSSAEMLTASDCSGHHSNFPKPPTAGVGGGETQNPKYNLISRVNTFM